MKGYITLHENNQRLISNTQLLSQFPFFKRITDCVRDLPFGKRTTIVEIETFEDTYPHKDDRYFYVKQIDTVRELSWNEVIKSINRGVSDIGDLNTCNLNDGNRNTGSCNIGDGNICRKKKKNTMYQRTLRRKKRNCKKGHRGDRRTNQGEAIPMYAPLMNPPPYRRNMKLSIEATK